MRIFNDSFSGIRFKILLLSFLTITPVVFLLSYFNIQQLEHSKNLETTKLKYIAQTIANENVQINEGARQVLVSLSISPQITDPYKCHAFLSNLLGEFQRYDNFGVADLEGNVLCSAQQLKENVNISNRYSFKQTVLTNKFTVGEYAVSNITRHAVLNFGYPVQHPKRIIYASLNLEWLNEFLSKFDLEQQMNVIILDRNGTILARYPYNPELIGKLFPSESLVNGLINQSGTIETLGTDGIDKLYAYEKIGESVEGPFVVVGIPKSILKTNINHDFRVNIILTVLTGLLSIVIGWIVGNTIIINIIKEIKNIENIKRDFISLVTHQIRTPITAIKWFTQILLSESSGKLTSRQKNILNDTNTSVIRMTDLVNTLLTISKLESGKIPLTPQATPINNLVSENISEIKDIFKHKNIKFKLKISSRVQHIIFVDPKLMSQVFVNLISNAYKYNHNHGEVKVNISKTQKNILIEITDNGIGIPQKDLDKLWSKFSRGSNAYKADTEGAGLGLYLSKLIVEAHGGKIWLKSSQEKGTSFFFTIPTSLR